MDIYITVANGGVSNIRLTVYKYKDSIKEKFANKNYGNDITEISYFLFINGDVTRYYESSGVYKLSYKPKKSVWISIFVWMKLVGVMMKTEMK
ncbi:hypothetical protein [Lysinibacillus sp. RS5]|uniref:hypothetical protein n=1 Tax=unclassified Lysinibacillus TaxID=2636778 RepID=UPI0035BE73F6